MIFHTLSRFLVRLPSLSIPMVSTLHSASHTNLNPTSVFLPRRSLGLLNPCLRSLQVSIQRAAYFIQDHNVYQQRSIPTSQQPSTLAIHFTIMRLVQPNRHCMCTIRSTSAKPCRAPIKERTWVGEHFFDLFFSNLPCKYNKQIHVSSTYTNLKPVQSILNLNCLLKHRSGQVQLCFPSYRTLCYDRQGTC